MSKEEVIYEVMISAKESTLDEFKSWLCNVHIPDMLIQAVFFTHISHLKKDIIR